MSYRDWLSNSAIRGCLAFILVLGSITLLSAALSSESPDRDGEVQTKQNKDPENTDTQSQQRPNTVIGVIGAVPPDQIGAQQAKNDENNRPNHQILGDTFAQWIMAAFGVVATFVSVWAVWLLRDTLKATREAVAETAKATEVAHRTVEVTKSSAELQLRAYLSVVVHEGIYQERERGLRFEGRPAVINSGQTPAYKTRYWANSAVLPFPLPDDFSFPRPDFFREHSATLGPSQIFTLNHMAESYVCDDDVPEIMIGRTRIYYIWGVVTYEDIFGATRNTKFCHFLRWIWDGEKNVMHGAYTERHNDAD